MYYTLFPWITPLAAYLTQTGILPVYKAILIKIIEGGIPSQYEGMTRHAVFVIHSLSVTSHHCVTIFVTIS